MDKTSVTRTFSIGGICSRTTAKEDFSSTRRHSSAGIRALLWATSSAKSLGCSLGSDSLINKEIIFPNIMTPSNIPQFTIPSLSVQNSLRSLDKEAGEDEAEEEDGQGDSGIERGSSFSSSSSSRFSSSTSFHGASLVLSDRKAERSISDPLTQRSKLQRKASCFHSNAQLCLDPTSQAALSLPHLAKVTTPYGFVTLSQSPHMVNEEALLCQAGLRHLNKDEETACCLRDTPGTGTIDNKGGLTHRPGDKKKPCNDSENKHRSVRGEIKTSTANAISATVSTSASQKQQDSKLKRSFCNVIRKHFTSRHSE